MFARKPALATASPSSASARPIAGLLANPYIGAGGAAAIFAATVGGLILALGDPHAGAPRVRNDRPDWQQNAAERGNHVYLE